MNRSSVLRNPSLHLELSQSTSYHQDGSTSQMRKVYSCAPWRGPAAPLPQRPTSRTREVYSCAPWKGPAVPLPPNAWVMLYSKGLGILLNEKKMLRVCLPSFFADISWHFLLIQRERDFFAIAISITSTTKISEKRVFRALYIDRRSNDMRIQSCHHTHVYSYYFFFADFVICQWRFLIEVSRETGRGNPEWASATSRISSTIGICE